MSKVKGAEEEKWKHAIGPLTQSELRRGIPAVSICLLPKHKPHNIYYANVFFFSRVLMLFIHKANGDTHDGITQE